jgi:hypothetical protein
MQCSKILILLLLHIPISAISCPEPHNEEDIYVEPEIRGYSTQLDLMDKTEHVIKTEYTSTKLRKIPDEYDGTYIHGIYSFGSFRVSLYPNYEYTIMTTCDICGDGELLEYGKYNYSKSKINLISDYKNANPSFIPLTALSENFGDFDVLNFFVTEKGNYIGDSILITNKILKDIATSENTYDYFTKVDDYIDWKLTLEKSKLMRN